MYLFNIYKDTIMNYTIKLLALLILVSILTSCGDKPTDPDSNNTIDKDIDGNVLKTVKICDQIWMSENLTVSHYRNGDPIPEVKDKYEWKNLKTGAWCYYNNDPTLGAIYGKLYNWAAVIDPRGLAPEGWHIATNAEWIELENCMGGEIYAGGKLKSIGTIENGDGLWLSPNKGATNESGFSGLPGGCRIPDGLFWGIGYGGYWWTPTEFNILYPWIRDLNYDRTSFFSYYGFDKVDGMAIRCVKD